MNNWDYILSITPYIFSGAAIAVKVYIITILLSIPLGMLCAVGKLSKFSILGFRPLAAVLEVYTWIFRGTPLLLQLFFAYFGLQALGIELQREVAAYVTFVINYAAYFTEIFRGGIQSIDRGQYEAAKALGMTSGQTMKKIIIPQGLKVVLPPTGNEAINLIKDTALCSVLGIAEITRNAKAVSARDFSIEGYFVAAAIYLIFTFVIIQVFRYLEKRFSYYNPS
ncbi:MAG: amino acid ABC transporter permease [Anaerovorax sp.]